MGEKNVYGGFSDESYDLSWSPDSKWIAYAHSMPNHQHAIFLYSVDTGQSTQVTNEIADSRLPAFDREGKFLYFTASTNQGPTEDGLDMTSDLYQVTSHIYAVVLAANQASPIAPELEDEKPAEKEDAKKDESRRKKRKPADEEGHGGKTPAAEADQGRPAGDRVAHRRFASASDGIQRPGHRPEGKHLFPRSSVLSAPRRRQRRHPQPLDAGR